MAQANVEKANKKEKWYGTSYSIEKIPSKSIAKWTYVQPHKEHFLPPPNEFLASSFEIAQNDNHMPVPFLLKVC